MSQTFTSLYIHFVFRTKERHRTIDPSIQPVIYEYIGGIIRNKGGVLLAAGGMADHIHLLVSMPKNVSVVDFIRDVKANSSRWMHWKYRFQEKFAWQAGYAAFSVSYSNLEDVEKYIKGQKNHHRALKFKEEVMLFLKKHNLPYDERYMWD